MFAIPVLLGASLLAAGAAASPASSGGALVDVHDRAPGVVLDMRYARPENFLHEAVYPCARCLLREDAARAIAKAQEALHARGLGLVLWDCYRPPAVQQAMWAKVPDARFVANPKKGSVHQRGGAVDVSLVDSEGHLLEMPTAHDDFSSRAAADAPASPEATKNRATLREAMEAAGLTGIRTEWWHFDVAGSRSWPIADVPLCDNPPAR